MAISRSAQETKVLSFRLVQDTLEFLTALTSAFSLLTMTMTLQHVYKIRLRQWKFIHVALEAKL